MTVAAPATVARLVLLKGPTVKSAVRECPPQHTHRRRGRVGGRNLLKEDHMTGGV